MNNFIKNKSLEYESKNNIKKINIRDLYVFAVNINFKNLKYVPDKYIDYEFYKETVEK